jgi:uncharacterized protein YfaS (alpha-2-macroglobulin family)
VVKKPLMVLGTLPRVLGPGETVKLPVSVFAMDKSVKTVKVEVSVNDLFSVTGSKIQPLQFSSTGDKMVTFDLAVSEAVGVGSVKITATSGALKAEHTIEISVRNPGSPVFEVYEKAIRPGESWTPGFRAVGIRGTNKGVLELSAIPPLNLERRLSYLIRYPYGCLEQTVSSAFPQLYLSALADLTESEMKEVKENISSAIQRLRSFRTADGGLSSWPGSKYVDDWGTSYAGHFLLEAEKQGYSLPVALLKEWKQFQRQKAVSWTWNASYANNDLAQAYRLFTLALAGAPELGAMNKLLERKDISPQATYQLAAAYQLAGKSETALRLINAVSSSVHSSPMEQDPSYRSDLRDKALIVDALCLLNMKTKAAPLVKEISALLCSESWFSTQSTSFALQSIARFTGNSAGSGINASIALNSGKPEQVSSQKPLLTKNIGVRPGEKGTLRVVNQGKNILFARLVVSGLPATGDTTFASNNLKITIKYMSVTGGVLNPKVLKQGTGFMAEVAVTNPGLRGTYRNMALTQVFPPGWEIIKGSAADPAGSFPMVSAFDYQDIRDDRVNTFFTLDAGQTKVFRVMLMATYQGRFYLPAAVCQAMYDNSINARTPGFWVSVLPF